MAETYKEVSWTSPELQQVTMYAEEQADLEIAKHPLTGRELDAIEDLRRTALRLETDMLLYGNAYIHTSGERVDPRQVQKSMTTAS